MDSSFVEHILNNQKIAYLISNKNLNIIQLGGAVDLFGIDESYLGKNLLQVFPALIGNETVLQNLLQGLETQLEIDWVHFEEVNHTTRYVSLVDLPYYDKGQITGLLHLAIDETEAGTLTQNLAQSRNELRLLKEKLNKQNIELEQANKELRDLDEMKSMFVSVAAHELRSPLTAINGYVELLLSGQWEPLSPEQDEILQIIKGSIDRLKNVAEDLTDITRLESDQMELWLEPTDISYLIQTIKTSFKAQLDIKEQNLSYVIPSDLPWVYCDPNRALQIMTNLVSNATKYTPSGGEIIIKAKLTASEKHVQISVKDTGVGISVEDQEKLFKRFFRAKNASHLKVEGIGLGLYITRSLVELHGGEIWLDSEPEQGSCFHITLPVAS